MKLTVNTTSHTYDIILGHNILKDLHNYINTNRNVFILCDTNIPDSYIQSVQAQCSTSSVYKVAPGEESKSMKTYEAVLQAVADAHLSRKDLLIALGGGVIGDLGGFVAATYMRGIEYMSIPTTTLSQIDSSIGGKVAINLGKTKNIVGNFYQPNLVMIDFDTLTSLPKRHIQSGLVEALKAGLIYDPSLYEYFKNNTYMEHLEDVIYKALCVKKDVVEKDEREQDLRKILNFGHTIGHAIESYYNLKTYYHGECVAMGMLYFINNDDLKQEVIHILHTMNLPETPDFSIDEVYEYILLDKKGNGEAIDVIEVDTVGKANIVERKTIELKKIMEDAR